ncbi:hypothetical protein C4L02_07010 [Salmonella enterica]|nr:hypothetical protein [Salmonella enterica]
MQVCIVLCVSCIAARKITILATAGGAGNRGRYNAWYKNKETGVDAGRSREQEKRRNKFDVSQFHAT